MPPQRPFFTNRSSVIQTREFMNMVVDSFTSTKATSSHDATAEVGRGPDLPALRKQASSNITFLGHAPDDVVKKHLETARVYVFAAEEDFGVVSVEAQACGAPVIAYSRGGAAAKNALSKPTRVVPPPWD